MKRILAFFIILFSCIQLHAQFSLSGSDPGNVRWMSMDSPGFRIIYPEGNDSLAMVYGSWLEKARTAVSWSSGMKIGEYYKSRMPVVLHSYYPLANASVAWAPRRMDFYTFLDPYAPTPITWERLLAIHEGRHASQMQAGAGGYYKPLKWLTGDLFAGTVAGLYAGPTILEGDAVVTETALSRSGRGRQASFLSFFAPAFDSGDWRNYWRWSLGSNKFYTPDHYRTGYMLISGMRVFYDDPLFTSEYFSRVRKAKMFPLRKTVKAASGKNIRKTFRSIEENYHELWASDTLSRRPFMPSEQFSKTPWRFLAYSGMVMDGDGSIWTKESGMAVSGALAKVSENGKTRRVRSFATYTSNLALDEENGRIYWSETVADKRWDLGGSARIRYVDIDRPKKVHDLTKEGRFVNPAPSPDGKVVCASEYPAAGGSRLVFLDSSNGQTLKVVEFPDSLQVTESAWVGERLFAAGLSPCGMGVYEVTGGNLSTVLAPQPVELSRLAASLSGLSFVCDRTGVTEMYLYNVDKGSLVQVTATKYGISSPVFNSRGDTLFYCSLAPSDKPEAHKKGNLIYSTPAKDLPMKAVRFSDIKEYPVAEELTAQEKSLSDGHWQDMQDFEETSFSEPRRYHKFTPRLHSWTPFYFNYDNVDNLSADEYYKTASIGATAIVQNLVGDGYGFIGYSLHEDPYDNSKWRNSAHLKYVYSGLFPVIEFSADIGDRQSREITRVYHMDYSNKEESIQNASTFTGKPFAEGSVRLYVPLIFSSGGISRGLVPQVRFRMTNDRFQDRISVRETNENQGEKSTVETMSLGTDHSALLSSLDLSVRGYIMRRKATSQIYPRLGIGAETGFRTRPGLIESYSNTAYLYTYGYLPGLLQNQGMKLTASVGAELSKRDYSYSESPMSFLPRGFVDSGLLPILNSCTPFKVKATVDYAMPVLNLDWAGLSPLVYVKNIVLTPFFDFSYYKFKNFVNFPVNRRSITYDWLTSTGFDLVAQLGNVLWLPFDSNFGFRYARNSYGSVSSFGLSGLKKDYFEILFDVSF